MTTKVMVKVNAFATTACLVHRRLAMTDCRDTRFGCISTLEDFPARVVGMKSFPIRPAHSGIETSE